MVTGSARHVERGKSRTEILNLQALCSYSEALLFTLSVLSYLSHTVKNRTVSAAGGWLMGGGLSYQSPLRYWNRPSYAQNCFPANGTLDAGLMAARIPICSNLRWRWWYIRKQCHHVHIKVHPVTPIIIMEWGLLNFEYLLSTDSLENPQMLDLWLTIGLRRSISLILLGGFFRVMVFIFVFAGTEDEATRSLC
jgi:hypothetical protein